MTSILQNFWRAVRRQDSRAKIEERVPSPDRPRPAPTPAVEIAPNDPIVAYFLSIPGAVEIEKLNLASPALAALKASDVKMVVPLVSQGELIGLLNLGPRLSQQEYSTDDRGLLSNLATQASPAVRVAQLVRQQRAEARNRERIEQELRVARLIQQTLLPKAVPDLPGWQIDRHYEPAREVGGDFYDFIELPDGRLGLVIADVTDKGVPAALVMATTRSILRAVALQHSAPGEVLERSNNLLYPDIPPNMFVTCLYAVLDAVSGQLRYANAGHDLPYRRHDGGVDELRARGMPLGLMPDMHYEEKEITLAPGEGVLFYSDGLVEAHNAQRAMFSFPRLQSLVASQPANGSATIRFLLDELAKFTGVGWEQEDDITMVFLERELGVGGQGLGVGGLSTDAERAADGPSENVDAADVRPHMATTPSEPLPPTPGPWRTLGEWTLPSEPGNERLAMEQVAEAVGELNLPAKRLERLKTAVAEATMNAIEHGNQNRPELPVTIQVRASAAVLSVRIVDQGGSKPIPDSEVPDIYAKLEGTQTPRGWGLFLIKSMVDDLRVTSDEAHHTIELILHLEGATNASQTA
jgi:serine phosphatase RsbU (regulator of sigma subunit)/anti-sigma regulatory factor (Ser/Thr protein kinase)